MALMGLKYLKQGKMMDGAMWYGKVCTACLFGGMVILFFLYDMKPAFANLLIGGLVLIMTVTLLLYVRFYKEMKQK